MIVEIQSYGETEYLWSELMSLKEIREEHENYSTKVVRIITRKDISLEEWKLQRENKLPVFKIDEKYLALVLKTILDENLVCIEHDIPDKTFVQYRIRKENGDTRSTSINLHELGNLYKRYLAVNGHRVTVETYEISKNILVNNVTIDYLHELSVKPEYEAVITLTHQLFKGKVNA